MHSFEAYERLIKLSVLIALAVLFIVAALSLLAGCETTDQPLVDDDSMLQPVQVVKISPDPNDGWPSKYKVDNMEAYDEFGEGLSIRRGPAGNRRRIPQRTRNYRVVRWHAPKPAYHRATRQYDTAPVVREKGRRRAPLPHLLQPRALRREQRQPHNFEWETGSRTLLVWCRDP